MPISKATLHPQIAALKPDLVIFDKDGTLIDFHLMWGQWATELGRRLEAATGLTLANHFFTVIGFDARSGTILPAGHLAVTPLAEMRALTATMLHELGLSQPAAETAVAAAWYTPDPVELARPLADLASLFGVLRSHEIKIAIATSDDRAPTIILLDHWRLTPLIDMVVAADDGLPIKPAPDMVQHICRTLQVSPSKTVMVGDNVADIQMGLAAAVGLTIGVLSGVSAASDLTNSANLVLSSIKALLIVTTE